MDAPNPSLTLLLLVLKWKDTGILLVLPGSLIFTLCLLSGDQYALKMRFVDHVFDEQVTDSLTVKIILPEGAK